MTIYGYWATHLAPQPDFPTSLWPALTEAKPFQLRGDEWQVRAWDIKIDQWPTAEQWSQVLKSTMQALIDAGALVAWCGLEGHFNDPPELFSGAMAGGIYAGLTRDLEFCCPALIGHPFKTIDRAFLELLRRSTEQSG